MAISFLQLSELLSRWSVISSKLGSRGFTQLAALNLTGSGHGKRIDKFDLAAANSTETGTDTIE